MSGLVVSELFKFDSSVGTFFTVHNAIGIDCIYELGSEEQKQKYIPPCLNFDKILCFGLTERNIGSEASKLETTVTPVQNGYILNGNKRWIGNGTFADYMILWARNTENNLIQGFLLGMKQPGITAVKIEGKYALRAV